MTKPSWSGSLDDLQLEYCRGRWRTVLEADWYRWRKHTFGVRAGDRVVAHGVLDEWHCHTLVTSLQGLAYAADTHSQASYDMANAMFASFCREESKLGLSPSDFGSIVLFHRLNIEAATARESEAVWVLINKLMARFRSRRFPVAGLLLKAFPLEYEGRVNEANRGAFERRQRALMRLYIHRLGMRTLPGWPGREGWQWLAINCTLKPLPSRRIPKI